MRTRSLVASLSFLLLLSFSVAGAQVLESFPLPESYSCSNCGKRTILVDNLSDLTTDHPQSALTAAGAGFVSQAFFASTFNCVTVLDSNHVEGPPMGDNYNWDYELYGEVSGSAPNYTVRAVLVAASDHELVAEATSHFDKLADAPSAGQFAVLFLGASSGGSIALDKLLEEWENPRRTSSRPGWNAKISTPIIDNDVGAEDKQTIKIEVRDCDDQLMKGARIEVRYSGSGTVSASTITTDDAGTATVDYTAPAESGTESITFYWPYKRPSGRLAQSTDLESIAIGAEYRLDFDSRINWTGTTDGITGMFRVQASIPLPKREIVTNTWVYEGTGQAKYTESSWQSGKPDCTLSATGTSVPLGVEFAYYPNVSGVSEMLLTVSQNSETFIATCKGISVSTPNFLWFGTFYRAHQSELSETVASGVVLKLSGWTVSPSGSETIATKTYTQSVTDGDVTAQESTTLKITKTPPSNTTTPSRRRAVRIR